MQLTNLQIAGICENTDPGSVIALRVRLRLVIYW